MNDKVSLPLDDDGHVFIDRNEKYFQVCLNYLRTGKWYLPQDPTEASKALEEIRFYGLYESYEASRSACHIFQNSILLDEQFQMKLNEWYDPTLDEPQQWVLLYRASKDGWKAGDFHRHVDRKGPTFTIILAHGYLFGGFTSISWTSSGGYEWDERAWLFSLTGPSKMAVQIPLSRKGKETKFSIYDHPDHGPTFGGGFDISVQGNANTSSQNYSNLGYSFNIQEPKYTEKIRTFFTGTFNFVISDIEVFGLAPPTRSH
eukprot:TRINITY_DN2924_c0_g1_i1.p1 TRINITY_DN2924_c0_g1~~TRINITY_DN2924_c0_g1_i1.p1  ORF type:complete len:259 (-),score=58.29 TRINITY_DN2924_c0_g1_i1:132-908(-)